MGGFAHGLMVAAYASLGLGMAVLLPRLIEISFQLSVTVGIVLFFGALQIHVLVRSARQNADQDLRVTEMEERTRFLRKDLERIRRDVQRVSSHTGQVSPEELVSELKVLQTLLEQVMRKQKDFEAHQELQHAETRRAQVLGERDRPEEPFELAESLEGPGVGAPSEPSGVLSVEGAADEETMTEEQLLAVIQSALSENRVDLYLQPMVSLPSRRIVHFECYSRVRDEDGTVIEPKDYLDLAASRGLLGTIDNLLLFRLIQLLRRLGPRRPDIRFFCNLSRHSLEDEEFFPQFIDFMLANRSFADRLVFEIAQADFDILSGPVRESLATLNRQGFAFSMDRIHSLDAIDRSLLVEEGFTYVKADHALISDSLRPDEISIIANSFSGRDLRLIASRIETEAQVIPLIDGDIELAQGYVFGQPALASHYDREL